jgi:guanine deaminase
MMNNDAPRTVLRGQVLSFTDDPFIVDSSMAYHHISDGIVFLKDGLIEAVGDAAELSPKITDADIVHDHSDKLIMAGFVDTHVHYSQLGIIGSYGTQLIEWLNTYTFPEEGKFQDMEYARIAAKTFVDQCLINGISTASIYCTVHEQSVDALFEATDAINMRMLAGKVLMDRHAPDYLMDTPEAAYDQSKALIERWHEKNRSLYSITPRFAPTSTHEQLEVVTTLMRENPTTWMQTHTSENKAEMAWVAELFPDCPDYVGVYEKYDLLGPKTVLGHAIHLSEREWAVLSESNTALSHCPTSNLFIGSGFFDFTEAQSKKPPVRFGLGTDVGGGSSFSMFHTMKAAYEVAQVHGNNLDAFQAFYMATLGGAKSLGLDDRIGNLKTGLEADLVVIDFNSTPLIRHRMQTVENLHEALFAQMTLADDRAIDATYISGKCYRDAKPVT